METNPASGVEKRPVRVNIFNQVFTILTADEPGEVERLAGLVDDLMRTYARSGNIDTTRAAVLSCLHLAAQMRTVENDLNDLRQRLATKSRDLSQLLDQVIEDTVPEE